MPADAIAKRMKGLYEARDGDFTLYPERPISVLVRPPKPVMCVLCGPSDAIVAAWGESRTGGLASFFITSSGKLREANL